MTMTASIAAQLSAPATPALYSSSSSSGSASQGSDAIDKASKDFEAVFLSQMMGAMFSGDDMTAFFGGGTAGEIYKSQLLNEYGKQMAQAGGIGIATSVKQELLKLQEVHKS